MIRFIHTADLHIGVENYGGLDPKTGIHTRLLDFEKALAVCIDCAIDQAVDFFLFCGDAYKTANPSPTQQKLLIQQFMRLYKAGIPIVIIVGNHDNPLSFGKAHSLDVFHVLPLDGFHVVAKPSILTLQTKHGPCQIVGIPWPTKSTLVLSTASNAKTAPAMTDYVAQALRTIIRDCASKLDAQIPAVLAGHLTASTGIFSGSEKRALYGTDPLLMISDLAIAPFDYVALGHLHRYQDLNPNGYPSVVYAGSLERIDFGERNEEKGFCLVSIEKKGTTTHTFMPTPTRPFLQVDVSLVDEEDQTKQLIAALKKQHLAGTILKITYRLPAGAKDTVHIPSIHQACSTAHYIAGIIPIYAYEVRERRMQLANQHDPLSLLAHYFEQKKEYALKKDELLKKVALLFEEQQIKESELAE